MGILIGMVMFGFIVVALAHGILQQVPGKTGRFFKGPKGMLYAYLVIPLIACVVLGIIAVIIVVATAFSDPLFWEIWNMQFSRYISLPAFLYT